MKTTLTCIECPMGCPLTVEHANGKILFVIGNGCARGKIYATDEVICPRRILTTTVRLSDGRLVSVKTDRGIPKDEIADAMKRLSDLHPDAPIKIGDVLLRNVSKGVNLIATSEII